MELTSSNVASVDGLVNVITDLLAKADEIKPTGSFEPPLKLGDFTETVESLISRGGKDLAQWNAAEASIYAIFYDILVGRLPTIYVAYLSNRYR
jgi:hypothetical protein